jgi:alkaline phosphatase D
MLLVGSYIFSQIDGKPRLFAGPVIGGVTTNSAKIWIGYRGKGQNALILGDTSEKKVYYPTSTSYLVNKKGEISLTMDFTGLKPDKLYNILVSIDGWGPHVKYSFRTDSREPLKDFNFLLGSCNLLQYDVTRGLFPGGSNWIFYRMKKKKPDFMVWLGDNLYYLYKRDWNSFEGMFKKQMKTRRVFYKFYRDFLGNQPNYAIWDDHDYGPDNSGKDFVLKDTSLMVFKSFWPNYYPEQEQLKGNFYSFKKYDAEFFMTDDRFYRDKEGDTLGNFLGETQILWLKNKLQNSDATFKFICVGSQVLTDSHFGESYGAYPRERNDLLDFIANNHITGVVFLTGDKHFSEVCTRNWKGYTFYDFTCSPLTTPPLPRRLLGAYTNANRVKGTDYARKNFGRISISGEEGDRTMKIEVLGRAGKVRRSFDVHQNTWVIK